MKHARLASSEKSAGGHLRIKRSKFIQRKGYERILAGCYGVVSGLRGTCARGKFHQHTVEGIVDECRDLLTKMADKMPMTAIDSNQHPNFKTSDSVWPT